ncbi:MAG: 1-deoxy-D-xylulose-5-phosphate reductoisomerase [Puniceicoccales bacterium]|jgi:1-deoxy-D-xylulose-5-phosphate reductoisomerase|nr:1-deoxy-D-xylulose-5-phosphate reductoisomerase [Puniceicoccales bacterium]
MSEKNIVLLGATGSIGESTLKVARKHPGRVRIVGIAANTRYEPLAAIAREFGVREVALYDRTAAAAARASGLFPADTHFHEGAEGLLALATLDAANLVVMAVVGTLGLHPALAAIRAKKTLALASKEILVLAGKFVMAEAARLGVAVLPLDSEHNAIFQCLHAEPRRHVENLILTASGGPFRDFTLAQMRAVTPAQALRHPNWDMGPKVTIDSSTMANKGLELIEARWLFDIPQERIEIVVHPQSIIHSLVRFVDGSVLAQLSPPAMTFPIQHCLFYPERVEGVAPPLDFSQTLNLELRPPDYERFPCLRHARAASAAAGVAPAVFNAANEVAVAAFVKNALPYLGIPEVIGATLAAVANREPLDLEDLLAADADARRVAAQIATTTAAAA